MTIQDLIDEANGLQLSITMSALLAIEDVTGIKTKKFADTVFKIIARHFMGDWGDVDEHDRQVNDTNKDSEGRVMSVFTDILPESRPLWVITDAGHNVTTILLPEDY